MDWSGEQIIELTRLWGEGYSAREIGEALGISRNAVIGKAHRLNLEKRPSPIKWRNGQTPTVAQIRERKRLRRKILRAQHKKAGTSPKILKFKPKIKKASVMDWTAKPLSNTATCQHIAGDPAEDPSKCGKPAVEGKPYCPEHCAACYIVMPARQAEAA